MKLLEPKARKSWSSTGGPPATAKQNRAGAGSAVLADALTGLGRSIGVGGGTPSGLELVAEALRDVAASIRELATAVEARL